MMKPNLIAFRLLSLFFLLVCCLSISARRITGRVVDASDKDLPGATVELLSVKDSSVIRSTVVSEVETWGWKHYEYKLDVDNNTTYLLRVSMVGFVTQYKKVSVKMADRVAEQWIDDIKLKEDTKTLSEVVVKATKIKMVMRGDTIVYNADAFNLSEGSMLDALIKQLPGATLENGVIKVGGREVKSLLIDGRDFFNGDAKKALENLPAYTVDKVKVYDKAGKESRFFGRDMGDKSLVVDVNLKKQYKHGYIGNVDVAYGTHDRYQGRLFAMGYGKKSRLTLAANLNNVNNEGVPGEDDATGSMPSAGSGTRKKQQVQLEYRLEGKTEDDYFQTTNSYSATDDNVETNTNSQTFLTGGDYYNLNANKNRAKNYTWSTSNYFGKRSERQNHWGGASVSHTRNKGWGNSLSGRFNAKPWGMSTLDSIYRPDASRSLTQTLINRVRNDNQYKSHSTNYNASYNYYVKLGKAGDRWSTDNLNLLGNVSYSNSVNRRFALNLIDYFSLGTNDNRDQYSESPNKNYSYQLSANYTRFLLRDTTGTRNLFVRPSYDFSQSYSSQDYALYRLDQLADYDSTTYALGVLPSTREALIGVQDSANSYLSRNLSRDHKANLTLSYTSGNGIERPRWQISAQVTADFKQERLDYFREKAYYKSRHDMLLTSNLWMMYQFNDSTGFVQSYLTYTTSESQPSLSSQLDIRNDANPLAVTLGNPDVKNARRHNLYASWSKFSMSSQSQFYVTANYSITQNALATAMLYDKQTGVTTTQQQNVNGNWSLTLSQSITRPVDKKKHLSLSSSISGTFTNSVDLTTVEGTPNTRSDIHNWFVSWNPGVEYQLGDKLRLNFNPLVTYQRATSDRPDFTRVSAWIYNFGLSGFARLPWHLELSTDLTNYNRSGYNDSEMNTSEWIWNARLTRSFLKSKLTVSLDAFDILNQLKNTTFTLNSQGRTEQWTNSLPRYAMLHVAYKITMGAKRK